MNRLPLPSGVGLGGNGPNPRPFPITATLRVICDSHLILAPPSALALRLTYFLRMLCN